MSDDLPLIGHSAQEREFLDRLQSGKLHHGWIVQGPSGIGKARLVRRLSAHILSMMDKDYLPENGPVASVLSHVIGGNHPDLMWVERELNDKGKLKQDISVDQVRELNRFFSLKPALGGWRVGVLDALDEANRNGLNALLKTLEEPPGRSVLFLISHGTAPPLATIRSRCQVMRLSTLSDDEVTEVLAAQGVENRTEVATLARGRPGRGIELADARGISAANAARTLIRAMPRPGPSHLANAFTASTHDGSTLRAFSDELLAWLSSEAEERPEVAQLWLDARETMNIYANLHLTEAQTVAKLIAIAQNSARLA